MEVFVSMSATSSGVQKTSPSKNRKSKKVKQVPIEATPNGVGHVGFDGQLYPPDFNQPIYVYRPRKPKPSDEGYTMGPTGRRKKKPKARVFLDQERFLPIANVVRIMKGMIHPSGKMAKEAKECLQECVSEFISFIASEAADKCIAERRKTITADDLLTAMEAVGFDNYIEPMHIFLNKFRAAHQMAGPVHQAHPHYLASISAHRTFASQQAKERDEQPPVTYIATVAEGLETIEGAITIPASVLTSGSTFTMPDGTTFIVADSTDGMIVDSNGQVYQQAVVQEQHQMEMRQNGGGDEHAEENFAATTAQPPQTIYIQRHTEQRVFEREDDSPSPRPTSQPIRMTSPPTSTSKHLPDERQHQKRQQRYYRDDHEQHHEQHSSREGRQSSSRQEQHEQWVQYDDEPGPSMEPNHEVHQQADAPVVVDEEQAQVLHVEGVEPEFKALANMQSSMQMYVDPTTNEHYVAVETEQGLRLFPIVITDEPMPVSQYKGTTVDGKTDNFFLAMREGGEGGFSEQPSEQGADANAQENPQQPGTSKGTKRSAGGSAQVDYEEDVDRPSTSRASQNQKSTRGGGRASKKRRN